MDFVTLLSNIIWLNSSPSLPSRSSVLYRQVDNYYPIKVSGIIQSSLWFLHRKTESKTSFYKSSKTAYKKRCIKTSLISSLLNFTTSVQ